MRDAMSEGGTAARLATDFDAILQEVIDVAESCDDERWSWRSFEEARSVGVLFDHIAAGNDQAVEWASALLSDRPVEVDPGLIDSENAAHAREAKWRSRAETVAALRASTERASRFLHHLSDEQLEITQRFGWLGPRNVAFVVRQACRHPQTHLQSIRQVLNA